jgi:hypothetical protein
MLCLQQVELKKQLFDSYLKLTFWVSIKLQKYGTRNSNYVDTLQKINEVYEMNDLAKIKDFLWM